ncbi:hypothetical protein F4553_003978 [Allocatelliglobosispora scoriae]|uniref:TPM domain-containing protein n=1 Tax=Allocatelliglobosispora scoriae TaxID=643052 RepID=A0A841BTW3_9ACTN|nr:hypothetical protein [Allocatelliglobosispora scoriae]MBB5870599.1 hypothetical protein [Allocatelliglobosispora scoriae]
MPDSTGGYELFGALACMAIAAVLLILLVSLRGRRRSSAPTQTSAPAPADPFAQTPTKTMSDQANAALVEADNALRTSEQELGFAQAQYGAPATEAFAQALAASRADVVEAFRLRQRLDDEVPEDEPTQRAMLRDIIERCAAADQRLDSQADAFHQLRALETQVDTLLPGLATRHAAAKTRLTAAAASWQALLIRYADTALAPVADNVGQATTRVDFAGAEVARAQQALTTGDRPAAALATRGAEQALGQASTLLDALDSTAVDLEKASAAVATLLADTQAEVAAGKAALQASGASGSGDQVALAAAVARADQIVTDVRAGLGAARSDPMQTLRRLEGAATGLGESLGSIRDAAAQAQHARALLHQALFSARSTIDTATEFITTRRGAIGAQARTRLSEAQRRLEQATAVSSADPVAALASAQSAQALAEQAVSAARSDVEQWSTPSGGYGGNVVIGGGGLGGAVLGGILLEGMLGGGGGGFGGRPGMGGGYRRGRGGGGFRISGFADTGNGSIAAPPETELPPVPGRFGGPTTWSRDLGA